MSTPPVFHLVTTNLTTSLITVQVSGVGSLAGARMSLMAPSSLSSTRWIPLVDSTTCNRKLKAALNNQRRGVGDRFTLSPSEICAGAEVGKDACTGDGGSPLVCQAKSGRWTVMGLVTWGVGCASDVPGVYARVSHFRNR